MTVTQATTRAAHPHDTTTPHAVPAPRRSPEQSTEPDVTAESYGYPLIRYAMEHATALRPSER
jgi:hypothetical protein